jgi:predicted DNA-binding transcriptional regulator YafY
MPENDEALDELTQTQRERLAYIDFCLYFHGGVSRSDLEQRFGVSVAAASRDLACYRGLVPGNMTYDGSEKVYRIAEEFRPINPFSIDRVLSWLRQGFGDGLALSIDRVIASDFIGLLAPPCIEILGTLARAIAARKVLVVRYLSLSSGVSTREIVPLAFVDNGLRWHVRAYDRKNRRFGDFVINRITSARHANTSPEDQESLRADEQWQRVIRMEIVPHPGVEHPEAVEADYGMKQGVLIVETHASTAGYALARWNVDASRNHVLNPLRHHLWLRNSDVLAHIESAALAPGYQQGKDEGA